MIPVDIINIIKKLAFNIQYKDVLYELKFLFLKQTLPREIDYKVLHGCLPVYKDYCIKYALEDHTGFVVE